MQNTIYSVYESQADTPIKILPARQIPLYQKISLKAKQLYSLGMSYQQIAKSLNVGGTTIVTYVPRVKVTLFPYFCPH